MLLGFLRAQHHALVEVTVLPITTELNSMVPTVHLLACSCCQVTSVAS